MSKWRGVVEDVDVEEKAQRSCRGVNYIAVLRRPQHMPRARRALLLMSQVKTCYSDFRESAGVGESIKNVMFGCARGAIHERLRLPKLSSASRMVGVLM